ncbi:MAG: type II secretion system protein [Chloroflexi bacterium]|nr:type II secretion system protein [Chloroflexota bacterium]
MRDRLKRQEGFTLLEMVVVIAVIGILAGIAAASTIAIVGGSKTRALASEQEELQKAVSQFNVDLRKGPDSSNQWGSGALSNHYPTRDGTVGDLELSIDTFDPDNPDNPRLDKYKVGPETDGAAVDADLDGGLVWMGLLVNEPFGTTPGDENTLPGTVHPLLGEPGQYLGSFPKSAAEANTDIDAGVDAVTGNGRTDGSYHWVVLQDGRPVPVYKSGLTWFSGSDGTTYP